MGYQYLMLFENNMAEVFYLDSVSDKKPHFERLGREGEKEGFPIEEDFWEWWKDTVSYLKNEPVDFCFLYDREYEVLKTDFDMIEDSVWDISMIEDFFKNERNYLCVKLIDRSGNENIYGEKAAGASVDTPEITFYSNIRFDRQKIHNSMQVKSSLFARYFRELLGIVDL